MPVGNDRQPGLGKPGGSQGGIQLRHMGGGVACVHRKAQPVAFDIIEKGPVPAGEILPREAPDAVSDPNKGAGITGEKLFLPGGLSGLELLAFHHRQLIAAVVVLVLGVPLDPVEVHGVVAAKVQQPFPKVGVQGGLFVSLYPALGLPGLGPALFQRVDDVFGVGVKLHQTGLFQGFQRRNDPGQLHAVVGGVLLAAGKLLLKFSRLENDPPASGAGVARAGPVGVDGDSFHRHYKSFVISCRFASYSLGVRRPASFRVSSCSSRALGSRPEGAMCS